MQNPHTYLHFENVIWNVGMDYVMYFQPNLKKEKVLNSIVFVCVSMLLCVYSDIS